EIVDMRRAEPAVLDEGMLERRPDADGEEKREREQETRPRRPPAEGLRRTGRFEDEPGRAQESVAREEAQAGDDREAREEAVGAADEDSVLDSDPADIGAEHEAL